MKKFGFANSEITFIKTDLICLVLHSIKMHTLGIEGGSLKSVKRQTQIHQTETLNLVSGTQNVEKVKMF